MKMILAILLSLSAFAANAELSCKATEVLDSSILEESFSVDEYPDVWVDEEEAFIGASHYSMSQGDKVRRLIAGFSISYEVTTEAGEQFLITFDRSPVADGRVLYREDSNQAFSPIATINCK